MSHTNFLQLLLILLLVGCTPKHGPPPEVIERFRSDEVECKRVAEETILKSNQSYTCKTAQCMTKLVNEDNLEDFKKCESLECVNKALETTDKEKLKRAIYADCKREKGYIE